MWMLPLKLRLRLLSKLAQAVPGSPASPGSPTAPGDPASPTSPTSPTIPSSTTSGPKKSPSQPATAMMNLTVGWTTWAQPINALIAKIDKVIIAGTKQKHSFNDLFQNKFPSGVETEFPPPDPTGDIIRFGKQIYQLVMNGGAPFRAPLQPADMRNRIDSLLKSPYLQKFQQVNMKGPLATAGVDLSSIRNDLLSLLNSIPAA
jgi:hypothetical protein